MKNFFGTAFVYTTSNFTTMRFKNLMMTALAVAATGTATMAQEDNPGGFGLKGGIGLSTLNFGNNDQSYEEYRNAMKLGGLLGVSYEKRIGDHFALDFEALLANKGSQQKYETTILGNTVKTKIKNNIFTVDVPVSAKIYFGDNFNIYAGPYFSYIFGGRLKTITEANGDKKESESEDYFSDKYKDINGNNLLNRFDIGANIGLEFVTNGGFGVGARLQQGFMDLTNDDHALSDGKNVRNTNIQIYGLIRF